MSKCENCIKNDMCYDRINYGQALRYVRDGKCRFFKDKSLCVELPCKVGDEVFVIDWEKGTIKSRELIEVNFDGQLWCRVSVGFLLGTEEIFLTKEEAEKKLKEIEGK